MINCVAAIQFDEETQRFVLVAGESRVEIRKTKALKKFVKDAPDISMEILAALKDTWFPDAEFEEVVEHSEEFKSEAMSGLSKALGQEEAEVA
jgi:hypothetical protein